MELTSDHIRKQLGRYLGDHNGHAVEISGVQQLSGGAIQENWAFKLQAEAGPWQGAHHLVLRCDARSGVAVSHSRTEEFSLLKAAEDVGVRVPKPYLNCEDEGVLGRRFFVMQRAQGSAAGHLLVRQSGLERLAGELGENLARIHRLVPSDRNLAFLGAPPAHPALATIDLYRHYLDQMDVARPAIEWGLRWLERNAREPSGVVLCHRDYRTGNYLVEDGRLTAVLDWEFAGWSDPLEDIGWFCAKCWRFGAIDRAAGGIGNREDFYQGYEAVAGKTIDRDAISYWEVMAHVRWAIIACQQAARHLSGEERSLELALTAHMVPELELEILDRTEPQHA